MARIEVEEVLSVGREPGGRYTVTVYDEVRGEVELVFTDQQARMVSTTLNITLSAGEELDA